MPVTEKGGEFVTVPESRLPLSDTIQDINGQAVPMLKRESMLYVACAVSS